MPDYSPKRLLLSVTLVCSVSAIMQVLVFSKRQDLHYRHFQQIQNPTATTTNNHTVDGVVAAIGTDTLHFNDGKNIQAYRCQNSWQYRPGDKLRITIQPGTPPSVIHILKL